jgi:signal transduction histidine kinase/ActR/RegA family two-component response regulator
MPLDNRTLIVSAILVTTVLSLLDVLIWRTRRTFPGFGRWAIAHALFSPTLFLFSLRSILSDWWTMVAANILAMMVSILVLEAAREFRGLRPRTWQAYAWGACSLAVIFYFRYVAHDMNVRILVAALSTGGLLLYGAKVLLTDVPEDRKTGMRYTGWLLVACALLQISRGIYFFLQPPITDFFAPSKINATLFVGLAIASAAISFGVLVMTGERLMSDLKAAQRQTAQVNLELNRLRRGLETAVKERTTELREAQQALVQAQKLESLGRLAGGVAHDFNNFLTVIRGYSRLLTQGIEAGSPLRNDLTQMTAACDQAMLLTQQLLAFSRRQSLEVRVLDVNDVILGMSKMLRHLMGSDIEVVIAASRSPVRINADSGQMHQVMLNLFLNARDAMPYGGVLRIETAALELTEGTARRLPDAPAGPYVAVTIRDEGGGMDEETQSHMFEPFYSTKPPGGGTGLGLATVYGIVKQSGGHILVETKPGQGTTFQIFWPSTNEEGLAEQVGANVPPAAAPGSARILIIDDSSPIRKVLRRVLESVGYEVMDVESVDRALDLLQSVPVDAVLTDMQMPGRSGVELARAMASEFPQVHLIAMSGFEDTGVQSLPGELGIEAVLTKPMQPDALIETVHRVIEGGKRKHSGAALPS